MIAVLQRVTRACVRIDQTPVGAIHHGLAVLAAIERDDAEPQARWLAGKIATLRAFPDQAGQKPYDRDVREVGGAVLLLSNFTLAASCAKGRRPSLDRAASPAEAQPVFEKLLELLRAEGVHVETGRFGAMMQLELINDGPVTFLLQTPR